MSVTITVTTPTLRKNTQCLRTNTYLKGSSIVLKCQLGGVTSYSSACGPSTHPPPCEWPGKTAETGPSPWATVLSADPAVGDPEEPSGSQLQTNANLANDGRSLFLLLSLFLHCL